MRCRIPFLAAFVAMTSVGLSMDDAHAQTPSTPPEGSLTLAAATSAALARNPGALAARQQFLQAQARVDEAEAQTHSQITFSSSAGVSSANVIQPPPSRESFGSWTNTIALPLSIGRKPRLAVTQANLQLQAAQAAWDGARLALGVQVGAAYYDLLRKEALLAIARDTQANAARQRDETQKRFQAGEVPELDVLRAQGPMASAQASVFQAESDVAAARQTLNSLVGRPLDTPIEAEPIDDAAAANAKPDFSMEDARARAAKNSPDVRSAEAAEMAADAGVKLAHLSREPVYALQLSDTRSNDQTSFSRLDSLQATVTIPLSDGGLAKAQQRESAAAREQAHAQTEAARRVAALAASTSYLAVQASARQIDAARTAADIARTTYDKTKVGYGAGLFPLSDVLTGQSVLTQARIALIQATYDAAVARAALDNALGILP